MRAVLQLLFPAGTEEYTQAVYFLKNIYFIENKDRHLIVSSHETRDVCFQAGAFLAVFLVLTKDALLPQTLFFCKPFERERDSFSAQNCFPVYLNHREETQALLMGHNRRRKVALWSPVLQIWQRDHWPEETKNAQAFSFVGPQPHHSVSTRGGTSSPLVVTPGHKVLYKSRGKQNEVLTVCTTEEAAMQGDPRSSLLG